MCRPIRRAQLTFEVVLYETQAEVLFEAHHRIAPAAPALQVDAGFVSDFAQVVDVVFVLLALGEIDLEIGAARTVGAGPMMIRPISTNTVRNPSLTFRSPSTLSMLSGMT